MRDYRNPKWLYQKYWDEALSTYQIARLVGVDPKTIWLNMKKQGIPRRTRADYKGDRGPNWRGGRSCTADGYVEIHVPDHPNARYHGYVAEHRLIVEKALGRYLRPDEYVHHVNGKKDDNRLENLELIDHHKRRICPRCGWSMGDLLLVKRSD